MMNSKIEQKRKNIFYKMKTTVKSHLRKGRLVRQHARIIKRMAWSDKSGTSLYDYPSSFGYKGETKLMSPDVFLHTTYGESKKQKNYDDYLKSVIRRPKVEELKPLIAGDTKIDLPYLEFRNGKPWGHEGRHRMMAAKELGIKEVPVKIVYGKMPEQYDG